MEYLKVDPELCVECGQCSMVCEVDALEAEWGKTKVIEDLCILCGLCVEFCPVEALILEKR